MNNFNSSTEYAQDIPFFGFYIQDGNLMYFPESKSNQNAASPIFVSSEIKVIACTRDQYNENHGRLLEFCDLDNVLHRWPMPMELLGAGNNFYQSQLLSMGLTIGFGTKAKNLLTEYLLSEIPETRITCVTQTGWHHHCFVLPDETIGITHNEEVMLQSVTCHGCHVNKYHIQGSLHDWQQHIARYCMGNSRLLFACSASFASPLLHLLELENGGFHIRGPSSIGKTTTLRVAASVWSSPGFLQSWRATANGLEATAALHNDTLLCLDEISQADPKEVGDIAYTLANGMGKARSRKTGDLQKISHWRLLFLSTGEVGLAYILSEAGKKSRAGQETRLIDIPADTGVHGLFEELHGFQDGAQLAKHLTQATTQYYGVAAREFLSKLTANVDAIKSQAHEIMRNIQGSLLPKDACGQVERVLSRMALVGAAGEIATSLGITGWEEGAANAAVVVSFNAWIESRGNTQSLEKQQLIDQVCRFFQLHGSSRFSPWIEPEDETKTYNRAGFWKNDASGTRFHVFPRAFREEICQGFEMKFANKVLKENGLLIPGPRNESTQSTRYPGEKQTTRCYIISSKVFSG